MGETTETPSTVAFIELAPDVIFDGTNIGLVEWLDVRGLRTCCHC